MIKSLSKDDLRRTCGPVNINIPVHTGHSSPSKLLGQDRVLKALKVGIGIKAHGFNIFVSGSEAIGALDFIKDYVSVIAAGQQTPPDWCYVYNFKNPYEPTRLQLPCGGAVGFRKDVRELIRNVYQSMVKSFESEDYARQKKS